jgi:hypothetical protein
MTKKISFVEFTCRFAGCDDVYFKLVDLPDPTYRGEIIKSDKVVLRFDYELSFNYEYMPARLFYFRAETQVYFRAETQGIVEYSCDVRVASLEKVWRETRLTLVDIDTAIEIEPTEKNALLFLEQLAAIEEAKIASQKV